MVSLPLLDIIQLAEKEKQVNSMNAKRGYVLKQATVFVGNHFQLYG
jgi:hypothetical protein